ncbi:copper(I)-binding protein [Rhodoblastus acidophilus]|uniref:copper chaperone PCu(A)C n=1 Tax=Rhodoblastus acidophilus TaxID=1074 RepID=UPI0022244088|nr:copper chaperone PCu(A)C [Rhodoblastus acidophilus]MCW2317818.1 copper(I)-binding protein [Rhodoblastus acidophilus]
MSRLRKIVFGSAFLALAAAPAGAAGETAGAGQGASAIQISAAWTRATVRGASVGAGYLTIDNQGGAVDTFISAASDRAERVELHQSREEGGVMIMRAVPKGVEIKPGKQLVLKPGGYHLMLVGLKSAFLPGETVHVTLHFAKAGDVGADLQVEGFGAQGPDPSKPAAR